MSCGRNYSGLTFRAQAFSFCFHAGWRTLCCSLAEGHNPVSRTCAAGWAEYPSPFEQSKHQLCLLSETSPSGTWGNVQSASFFFLQKKLSYCPETCLRLDYAWAVEVGDEKSYTWKDKQQDSVIGSSVCWFGVKSFLICCVSACPFWAPV